MTREEIIIEILNKGELQVSDLERDEKLESLKKDIANIIVQKCVSSEDKTQFPVSTILKAMNEAQCKINPNQSAKKQALDFMKVLSKVIPIERAKMKVKLVFAKEEQQQVLLRTLKEHFPNQFEVDLDAKLLAEIKIEPSLYRELTNLIK
eukprot:CAMPEP_0170557702 /NCGR_PEP_ID=MMETSP0211-20121228/29372_1 /TAXON_ID=311385 /ORGANISM="Pseudokeronopsis sp., Strain OXSARD2" /LENGTH=149 /DNA_ID=CAMNT_0010868953 /DNA_START=164 /DNA_END=610 /DNA_ORIENTATION=-